MVVGHTRLKAAKKLGHETVPVHVAKSLTPKQARAYRLADNRTGREASWNIPLLADELLALEMSHEELAAATAFDMVELERFLGAEDGYEPGDARDDSTLDIGIFVTCTSEQLQRELYDQLLAEGYACKLIT